MDPFRVRAEVRTPLAAAVEENSDLATGFGDCGEVAAHNPQTGPRHEVAARSREVVVRNREAAVRSREAAPQRANAYGHMDQDGSRAGTRAAQPLRRPFGTQ